LASVNEEAQKNGARRDAVLALDMFCNTSALAPADAPATHVERAAEDAGFGDRARPGQEELEDSGSGGEKPPVQLSLRLKTQQEAPVLRASRLQTKQKNARSTFDEAVLFEIVRIRKKNMVWAAGRICNKNKTNLATARFGSNEGGLLLFLHFEFPAHETSTENPTPRLCVSSFQSTHHALPPRQRAHMRMP